jgi:CRP-like cAMP-binding protein
MKSLPVEPAYKNRVLASLPELDMKRLAPFLSRESFKADQTLHDNGQTIETIYFMETALCSVVVTLENGSTVEVGLIGRDGFVGLPGVLGTGHSTNRSFIQVPGSGFSVKATILRDQCDKSATLRSCLHRGIQAFLTQTAQTAACNRVHELNERLARWLLMCQERVQLDSLPVTHDLLAMMLGTRRTTVTVAARVLQAAGLIEYSRGHVRIHNREGLKEAACECYSVVHDEYVKLGLL